MGICASCGGSNCCAPNRCQHRCPNRCPTRCQVRCCRRQRCCQQQNYCEHSLNYYHVDPSLYSNTSNYSVLPNYYQQMPALATPAPDYSLWSAGYAQQRPNYSVYPSCSAAAPQVYKSCANAGGQSQLHSHCLRPVAQSKRCHGCQNNLRC